MKPSKPAYFNDHGALVFEIGDGREICIFQRMFNTIITIGRTDDRIGFDNQW